MNSIKRKLQSALLLVSAAALLVAVGAAPASASIVNAKYSSGTIKVTTSGVTVKRAGIDPKACSLQGGVASTGTTSGASATFSNGSSPLGLAEATIFTCPSSTFLDWDTTVGSITAKYDTVTGNYFLEFWPQFTPTWRNPWGAHHSSAIYKATFTNGSGVTPSQLVLSEAIIGKMSSESKNVTLTGTFNVTTKEGGLLTLSH